MLMNQWNKTIKGHINISRSKIKVKRNRVFDTYITYLSYDELNLELDFILEILNRDSVIESSNNVIMLSNISLSWHSLNCRHKINTFFAQEKSSAVRNSDAFFSKFTCFLHLVTFSRKVLKKVNSFLNSVWVINNL